MGIRITTDDKGIKVWRSDRFERPTYAVQVSKKEGDGWINHYQPVRFRQGVEIANGTVIHIRDAFPTLDTWTKDGQEFKKQVWMILDFDTEGQTVSRPRPVEAEELPDSFAAAEDEIPF